MKSERFKLKYVICFIILNSVIKRISHQNQNKVAGIFLH